MVDMRAVMCAADEFGRTAMLLAVSRRDMQMTEALLNAGANVEGIGGTYNGRTALMQARSPATIDTNSQPPTTALKQCRDLCAHTPLSTSSLRAFA
jgi:ankyrin repeat protein